MVPSQGTGAQGLALLTIGSAHPPSTARAEPAAIGASASHAPCGELAGNSGDGAFGPKNPAGR